VRGTTACARVEVSGSRAAATRFSKLRILRREGSTSAADALVEENLRQRLAAIEARERSRQGCYSQTLFGIQRTNSPCSSALTVPIGSPSAMTVTVECGGCGAGEDGQAVPLDAGDVKAGGL